MRCVVSEDLPSFAATVLPWLEREPVLYNVLGTLIGQRLRGEVPVEPGCLWTYHATLRGSYRIYRLGELTAPTGVPGRLRPGSPDDVHLATGWANAFADEVGDEPPIASTYRDLVESWVRTGELWFWDVDAAPVSMAGSRPPVRGVVRISLVYTPPEQRGNGYAGALVAARSRQLLDGGASACMLYTDLSNPTSNAVYQRIGYRPVMDTQDWVFG